MTGFIHTQRVVGQASHLTTPKKKNTQRRDLKETGVYVERTANGE